MFRSIKGHKLYSGSIVKDIHGRYQMAVHAARIGDKPHPAARETLESAVSQDFKAGLHNRFRSCTVEREKQS